MSSSINEILQAVADMNVTVDGDVIPVRWDDTLTNTVESADLPVRLISFLNETSQRARSMTPRPGSVLQVEHTVQVIAILRAVGAGMGLSDIMGMYAEYNDSFLDASRVMGNHRWNVKDVQQRSQVLQYPANSDRWYHTVISTIMFDDRVM